MFLIQLQGRRRWRIGPVKDRRLVDEAPLKLLRHFAPTQDLLLEPGDLLYLPPLWGHDVYRRLHLHDGVGGLSCADAPDHRARGVAAAGRRAPEAQAWEGLYRDAGSAATTTPGRVPESLQAFARTAWRQVLGERGRLSRALGQWLTEPKPQVWFDPGTPLSGSGRALQLDRRSRMMYDSAQVYLNGEAYPCAPPDARLLRRLADRRELAAADRARLSKAAGALVERWAQAGWLHES